MNRQIKFRGKPIDPYYDVDFVYGFYMEDLKDGEVVPYIFDEQIKAEVLPDSVGQFSGLKDKNGTEIFEGDIIKFRGYGHADGTIGEMKWDDVLGGFYITTCYDNDVLEHSDSVCEVIGTIHTTPELLTDKQTNNE